MEEEDFVRIAEPEGYPVAVFRGRISHLRFDINDIYSKDGTRIYPREALISIIENRKKDGRPTTEYERGLKALEDAIQIWAWTPWDGR